VRLVPKPTPAHPESPTSRISATHGAPENDERRLARSASLQSGCRTTLDYLMEAMARWQPGTSENRFGGQICRVSLPWRVREYSRDRMHPRIAPGRLAFPCNHEQSELRCRHVRKHFFSSLFVMPNLSISASAGAASRLTKFAQGEVSGSSTGLPSRCRPQGCVRNPEFKTGIGSGFSHLDAGISTRAAGMCYRESA